MAVITLWHNPRCSKSRQALALLEQSQTPVTVRNYLESPPDLAELQAAHIALGRPSVSRMIRQGDALFKTLGFSPDTDDATLFAAMVAHPALIERPIAIGARDAVIGRPPERVLTLL